MSDLEIRVAKRKEELISEILEHKENSSRAGAADAVDRIKVRLSELAHIVKQGMGPSAKVKLAAWIAK